MNKKVRKVLLLIGIILIFAILVIAGYVLYVVLQYDRIQDNTQLSIEGSAINKTLSLEETYSIATYNIGFGAYLPDYSFFMDLGVMKDGTPVGGKYGKAKNKESVLMLTEGVISSVKAFNPDFIFYQEVDEESSRAYKVNQKETIFKAFPDFNKTFAINFNSAYLFYPLTDPHGKTLAGLVTLSRYEMDNAIRFSFPIDDSFPTRFFDLDRCFAAHYIVVENGKYLVLVNCHMSAYDEGGLIRRKQLEMLNNFITKEYNNGNYVIVGGDFNHALGKDVATIFSSEQQFPEWMNILDNSDLAEGFSIVRSDNYKEVPTCRTADIPYEKGVNFTTIIDGFIVSDNIEAHSTNINNEFAYSDHMPVLMEFNLK